MTFIDERVKTILHRSPPWRGFAFKVVENEFGIFLLVSLDEFANYSHGQQEDLSAFMAGICNDIRGLMIPCYIKEWKQ